MDPLRIWWQAAAELESDLAAEAAEEAYEVFLVEASRMRLVDRRGWVQVHLGCGMTVSGDILGDDEVADFLALQEDSGATALVPVSAIVRLKGSRPALRPAERAGGTDADRPSLAARSLASWLRDLSAEGAIVRLVLRDASVITGAVVHVGADHVELVELGSDHGVVVPCASVECWTVPSGRP